MNAVTPGNRVAVATGGVCSVENGRKAGVGAGVAGVVLVRNVMSEAAVVTGAAVVVVAAIAEIPGAVVADVVTGTSVYVCWFRVPEVMVKVVE